MAPVIVGTRPPETRPPPVRPCATARSRQALSTTIQKLALQWRPLRLSRRTMAWR